jgi:hypothetical protein
MTDLHRIRIHVGETAWFTRLWLDDVEMRGLVAVSLQVGIGPDVRMDEEPLVVLTIAPKVVEVEGQASLHVYDDHVRPRRIRPTWLRRSWRERIRIAWEVLRG